MKRIIAFLFGLGFLLCGSFVFAADVHFQWGSSTGQVDGYRIYYSDVKGGSYSEQLCEVSETTLDYTASLDESLKYYLVCRAFNTCGESGDSNEVYWCAVPGIPGTFQRVIRAEITAQIKFISK